MYIFEGLKIVKRTLLSATKISCEKALQIEFFCQNKVAFGIYPEKFVRFRRFDEKNDKLLLFVKK